MALICDAPKMEVGRTRSTVIKIGESTFVPEPRVIVLSFRSSVEQNNLLIVLSVLDEQLVCPTRALAVYKEIISTKFVLVIGHVI